MMSVHWAKADMRLRASRSDFDPRVPPLKPTGGGWSNRWRDEGCGPVGLVHTHKVGIKYKKPPPRPKANGIGHPVRSSQRLLKNILGGAQSDFSAWPAFCTLQWPA